MVFYHFLSFFHGFFKELDFKELEIHRYSLLDTINEYQWISINEYQWISINEFIDGPSMNILEALSLVKKIFYDSLENFEIQFFPAIVFKHILGPENRYCFLFS